MYEALVLLGQIFLIICLQTIFEVFVDPDKKSNGSRLMNIACFIGCLYVLMKFVFENLVVEIANVFTIMN